MYSYHLNVNQTSISINSGHLGHDVYILQYLHNACAVCLPENLSTGEMKRSLQPISRNTACSKAFIVGHIAFKIIFVSIIKF